MSSKHGLLREGTGTPTGGLILHGLVSCIFTAAVPLLPNSLEGFTFIINTYTYGHSVLNLTLAFGILFPILVHRMNACSTATVDNDLLYRSKQTWSWQILIWWPFRWACAGFLILVNSFLVVLPFIPTAYTDGFPRKIPTWNLPVTVLPFYVAGAVAGLFIVFISSSMEFLNSRVVENTQTVNISNFVFPVRRRWEIQCPEVKQAFRYYPLSLPLQNLNFNPLSSKFMTAANEKILSALILTISPLIVRHLLAIYPQKKRNSRCGRRDQKSALPQR